MFQKFKKLWGGGDAAKAAKVRAIVQGDEAEETLFEPGNERYLSAFVEYGHKFKASCLRIFLKKADRRLVKFYLSKGYEIDDEAKMAVIERQDSELINTLIASGSWVPFPHGCCTCHSFVHRHDKHQDDKEEVNLDEVDEMCASQNGLLPA